MFLEVMNDIFDSQFLSVTGAENIGICGAAATEYILSHVSKHYKSPGSDMYLLYRIPQRLRSSSSVRLWSHQ